MAFVPVEWSAFRNTDSYPNPGDLRKISGVEYAYDADAVSSQQIAAAAAGAGVRFGVLSGSAGGIACGLSHDNPSPHYSGIDYCIMRWADGPPWVTIFEDGVAMWSVSAGSLAYFAIVFNLLGQIEYWDAGDNVLLYVSTVAPVFPLFVDSSL